ncbi:MAG: dephospho-CoA kinase [Clostridia bacterium]|nr:dephospho-CoA kinase [Clostridia bacterium]
MIIGLTGESGAGKSSVARLLDMFGLYIIDCDGISRTLDTDKAYIAQVEKAFGREVISFCGAHKKVNRKALGEKVFGRNAEAGDVTTLNEISHPIIIGKVHDGIAYAKACGKTAVIDAPLLFESGLDKICDITIGVIAPEKVRIERLCARDGIDALTAKKRFAAQKDDAFLKANCTHIIVNDDDEAALSESVRALMKILTKGTDR